MSISKKSYPARPLVHVATLAGGEELPRSDAATHEEIDARKVAGVVLHRLDAFLSGQGCEQVKDLFIAECWIKDHLALTSDLRTFYGLEACDQVLQTVSLRTRIVDWRLTQDTAQYIIYSSTLQYIQTLFTFETQNPHAKCSGSLRIVYRDGAWRIWILYTVLEGLVDYPERQLVSALVVSDVANSPALQIEKKLDHAAEVTGILNVKAASDGNAANDSQLNKGGRHNPGQNRIIDVPSVNGNGSDWHLPEQVDVLIVGGGQAGLSLAARLAALGVSYLLVEKNDRIGDNWRQRYDRVKFHTVKQYGSLPFLPYPKAYSTFLSGKEMATHYENYVRLLGLDVVSSTQALRAEYDSVKKTWNVPLKHTRTGLCSSLQSRFIVFAIGGGGQIPRYPPWASRAVFKGDLLHSVDYKNGRRWKGTRTVVVGTANTAHDIVEDLLEHGAASVTMIQRSPTFILPAEYLQRAFEAIFNDDISSDVADRYANGTPTAIGRLLLKDTLDQFASHEPDRFEALAKSGFKVIRYGDLYDNMFMRRGGHYIDVGASKKIAEGLVQVCSTSPVVGLAEDGLEHADGSKTLADVIVLSTGFADQDFRAACVEGGLVDEESARRIEEVGGTDPEGEFRGMYTNACHPGLFFTGGQAAPARFFAKIVALQIKLELEGIRLARIPYPAHWNFAIPQ